MALGTLASRSAAGEILGLAGLVGAGRTEVARLIFGLDKSSSGEMLIEGKLATIGGPADAVRYGIGLVPEDRKQHGLVLMMDVKENISMAMLQRLSNTLGKINVRVSRTLPKIREDAFRCHSQHQPVPAILVEEISRRLCSPNG